MIDIHSHVLPMVDDGSNSVETSLEMVSNAIKQGVKHLFLTPHYRGVFKLSKNQLKERFNEFRDYVLQKGLDINLYLGQEIHVDIDTKKSLSGDQLLTLNDSKYLLLEFNYNHECEIVEYVYEFKRMGYIPIVAHAERYSYFTLDDAFEVKSIGGLIQVNADSLLGKNKRSNKRLVAKMIKNGLVDFVAGDYHSNRNYLLAEAYKYSVKKFGSSVADKIFITNGQAIIEK